MAEDKYGIDSHKLAFHPERVAQWRSAQGDWNKLKKVYPIYIEVSPTRACNCRCLFCALDYLEYEPVSLSVEVMAERLREMGALGVKSIMFAGEGEPLLHKGINELAARALDAGIDISFTTNGVLIGDDFIERTLPRTSWIKVSCNAGTPETYAEIHGTSPSSFDKVVSKLRKVVDARNSGAWPLTVGVQMLLLPENCTEAARLARICRDDIGADYLVIKPYSQHRFSETHRYERIDYDSYGYLAEKLEGLSSKSFNVIFRARAMGRHTKPKQYERCCSVPFFWAYVASDGGVYSCSAYLGDERFCVGNLNEKSFLEIWEGPLRERNAKMTAEGLDIEECRLNCRMDEVNIYLWQLLNPKPHVNFI